MSTKTESNIRASLQPVDPAEAEKKFNTTATSAEAQGAADQNAGSAPDPHLDGMRIRNPQNDAIYLVDRGVYRWIPDPETFNDLFNDWNGIYDDPKWPQLPLGVQITHDAVLVNGDDSPQVYLIDSGTKRWVVSRAVMAQYNFKMPTGCRIPHVLLDCIPTGDPIDGTN